MSAEAAWRPRLRVLCLHGRCQTAATFERKTEKLAARASSFAEFVYVDGPVELPLQHGERVNTRGWWESCDDGRGDDERVRETLARAWAEQGPFDGVFAFSEGTAAAVALCRMAASADAAIDPTGLGLRFAILAGAYWFFEDAADTPKVTLPSLHFASAADTCIPIAESRRLAAEIFVGARLIEHDGGHCTPSRAEDMRAVATFLEEQWDKIRPPDASPSTILVHLDGDEDALVPPEQRDELETLEAIFPELVRVPPAWPVRLAIQVASDTVLRFSMPPAYPQAGHCRCELVSENLGVLAHERDIIAAAEAEREADGLPCVTGMLQAARQWIEDHEADIAARAAAGGLPAPPADGEEAAADAWWTREEGEVDEAMLQEAQRRADELLPDEGEDGVATWARACGAGNYGRPWEFVVGLVGKPSAGKSTLFNASTRPTETEREASMAPHPFTTIDPNVGPGWFAAPCPAAALGLEGAEPEHGRAPNGQRRLPLLVKDVAGLVPGAYMGRGRGNAFLNDLCDADSLIHVVDASGRSDREGVDQGGGASPMAPRPAASDPLDEVGWVRREIHLWIFCNVRAKWDTVRRKARIATTHITREALADRLFALFTGYHCSRQLVTQVYEAAGFSLANMAEALPSWTEFDLHLLVACFLRARFPIVVALNKADTPEARTHVERARAKLGSACVAVSARSEWWLWDQQRQGHLTYDEGGGHDSIRVSDGAPPGVAEQVEKLRGSVFEAYGRTGVQEVFSVAVRRRRPSFVCPVADLASFEPLQRMGKASSTAAPLATMVLLRPLSRVEEAFAAFKREQLLRGDFVRAEVITNMDSKASRVLKRDETLPYGVGAPQALVLKVLTNKKAR